MYGGGVLVTVKFETPFSTLNIFFSSTFTKRQFKLLFQIWCVGEKKLKEKQMTSGFMFILQILPILTLPSDGNIVHKYHEVVVLYFDCQQKMFFGVFHRGVDFTSIKWNKV